MQIYLQKHGITEHYEWLWSLNPDRTLDIAELFSHALRSDANWWVDRVLYFFRIYQAQVSLDVAKDCYWMILHDFERFPKGFDWNTIAMCLQSSYRANQMYICKLSLYIWIQNRMQKEN